MPIHRSLILSLLLIACVAFGNSLVAMETVTYRMETTPGGPAAAGEQAAVGQVLGKIADGGMILETDEGAMLFLRGAEVISSETDDRPFEPITHEVMGERLLAELPASFRIHETDHYVIAYDTSREYAEWTSSLLERLNKALVAFWRKQGIKLEDPQFPLPIIIHSSSIAYQAASRKDGVGASAVGYYNLRNNRVRMYDITGSDELRAERTNNRSGSRKEISRMLTTVAAEPLVATIVHEATHQVSYNTGLMQRFADLPIWLVEGMAVYFEAPESGSSRGWRGIGKINYRRLATFRRNLPNWNNTSLTSLIATDERIRNPRTGGLAYADAWALNYYLIKRKPKDYVAYVKKLSERKPFLPATPKGETEAESRIALFEEHFGSVNEVSRDLLKYISRLK